MSGAKNLYLRQVIFFVAKTVPQNDNRSRYVIFLLTYGLARNDIVLTPQSSGRCAYTHRPESDALLTAHPRGVGSTLRDHRSLDEPSAARAEPHYRTLSCHRPGDERRYARALKPG